MNDVDLLGIFVDGALVPSSGSDTVTVVDPTREEVLGRVTSATAADVDVAVRSADAAMRRASWSELDLAARAHIVLRMAELIDASRTELAELAAREMGWPIASGIRLGDSVEIIRETVETARSVDFGYLRRGNIAPGVALVVRRPVGVVAGILPWNAPLRSAIKKSIPALLAGCSVVLKPAPEAPFEAFRLAEIAIRAGLPPGVLNVVAGAGEAGEALVRHPTVAKIAFTGSTVTGRRIATVAGQELKRVQLELGGKSAAILLDDVDAEHVARVLVPQTFRAAGQTCTALTRALVPRSRFDEIVDAIRERTTAEIVGDPLDKRTTVGPLVSSRQREKVLSMLEAARDAGCTFVQGSGVPPELGRGFFVEPTVLTNVTPDMQIAQEEVFGPVLSILSYDSEEQATDIANGTRYGLHGAVFSNDEERAIEVARCFESGSVSINGLAIPITVPFGGTKASGLGREHGPEGFDHFTEYQSIVVSEKQAKELATNMGLQFK